MSESILIAIIPTAVAVIVLLAIARLDRKLDKRLTQLLQAETAKATALATLAEKLAQSQREAASTGGIKQVAADAAQALLGVAKDAEHEFQSRHQ